MTLRRLVRGTLPASAALFVALLAVGTTPAAEPRWEVTRTTVPGSAAELRALESTVKKVVEKCTPCTVGIMIGMSAGSGVIVSEDGLVLTAGHVSGDPDRDCILILPDGKRAKGKTLGVNKGADSGMIKITDKGPLEGGKWPFLAVGQSADLKKGQWVVCLGHPGGWKSGRSPVLRVGQVQETGKDLIRTNCTLVGGDSGGPLFDLEGNVIGIHSRIGPSLTYNIHIPTKTFQNDWEAMLASEVVGRPKVAPVVLGVVFPEDEKAAPKLNDVQDDGPAGKAGLKTGDIIKMFDKTEVTSVKKVRDMLMKYKPGDKVEVQIQRGGETLTLTITLAKRSG